MNKSSDYASSLVYIWLRDDTTYRIGSAPYNDVLYISQAYLCEYTSSIGHIFFFTYG